MEAIDPTEVQESLVNWYRQRAAEYLGEQSEWRSRKSEQFPDDPRNATSARALAAAADYVRGPADKVLDSFIEFDAEMQGYVRDWTPDHDTGVLHVHDEDSQVVGRFWFGHGYLGREPEARDFDRLLNQVLDGIVRSESESISEAAGEVGFNQPPGSLVTLLEEWGFPIRWPDDGEDEED